MAYTPKKPRSRSKRSRKKDDKLTVMDWVKIILFVVGAAALVSVFIFLRADIGNVADDYGDQASELNAGKEYSKSQFNKQFEYANEQKLEEAKGDNASGGSTSATNGVLTAKENGELITDKTKNPYGMPLYDGWTLSEEKLKEYAKSIGVSEDYVSTWDVVYEDFWNTDTYKDTPQLYGLGDFSKGRVGHPQISVMNISACSKSSTQYQNWQKAKNNGLYNEISVMNGKRAVTIDGRVPVALPWRVVTNANKLTDEMVNMFNDPQGMTVNSPKGANGTKENSLKIGKPASDLWNVTNCMSMYVDMLLDDGTVVALVTADSKAIHLGGPVNGWGDICDDVAANGYAHIRYSNSPGNWGYQGIIELVCGPDTLGDQSGRDMLQIDGKKIVGFRAYSVQYVVNGNVVQWSNSMK